MLANCKSTAPNSHHVRFHKHNLGLNNGRGCTLGYRDSIDDDFALAVSRHSICMAINYRRSRILRIDVFN